MKFCQYTNLNFWGTNPQFNVFTGTLMRLCFSFSFCLLFSIPTCFRESPWWSRSELRSEREKERERSKTMANNNGEPSSAPQHDRWYNIRLGRSFRDHASTKFCTLRCEPPNPRIAPSSSLLGFHWLCLCEPKNFGWIRVSSVILLIIWCRIIDVFDVWFVTKSLVIILVALGDLESLYAVRPYYYCWKTCQFCECEIENCNT